MNPTGLSDSKQKQTSQNTTQNSYGWQTPPSTADIDKLRSTKFEVDPGIGAQFGAARRQLKNSFAQPTGAYYNPQVKEAQMRSANERLGEQESNAFRQGQFDSNRLGYGRDLAVAEMTAPTLVQQGSTSTGSGTMTAQESPFKMATGIGAALAPLSL